MRMLAVANFANFGMIVDIPGPVRIVWHVSRRSRVMTVGSGTGGQMADVVPVVLITGATSGLGRYLAGELAGSGWQVLAGGRDPGRGADLIAELGGGARGYVADLASLGGVREFADRVSAEVPRLDVL